MRSMSLYEVHVLWLTKMSERSGSTFDDHRTFNIARGENRRTRHVRTLPCATCLKNMLRFALKVTNYTRILSSSLRRTLTIALQCVCSST